MTQEIQDDDPIDALLREQFDGPVPDGGFSARVMQRIPRRRRKGWPAFAAALVGLLAGVAGCFASLARWPALDFERWYATGGHWSGSAIALAAAMAGLTLLTWWWGIAEADDH